MTNENDTSIEELEGCPREPSTTTTPTVGPTLKPSLKPSTTKTPSVGTTLKPIPIPTQKPGNHTVAVPI